MFFCGRPDKLNAVDPVMLDELLDYFGRLYTDEALSPKDGGKQPRVVVLRGSGKGFCAGLDLQNISGDSGVALGASPSSIMRGQQRFSELVMRMRKYVRCA